VSGIRGVDYVIPFEIEGDIGQAIALDAIRPHIFAKGGDRVSKQHLPQEEVEMLDRYGIEICFNVGYDKMWSSSDTLKEWVAFATKDTKVKERSDSYNRWSYGGYKKDAKINRKTKKLIARK